ncbi:MAG: hypothetical protein ACKODX_23620 [Gemmata sp.]
MKVQQKDLYHGAALTQLVEHDSFKALNKADGKYGHYQVNTDRRLIVKLTEKAAAPWSFTFQPDDLDTLRADIASGFQTFVVLVCGKTTVCLLEHADFATLIDLNATGQQWIKVEMPKASMRVRGSAGELKRAVKHNAFPADVFA